MGRGIDHLVLAARDLESTRGFYARLGFTLTPRAQHPWGTANHLVQLEGCFLELLGVAEPEKITSATPGTFGFGAFNRDFLVQREGMSMLVFESHDARADRDEFAAKQLSDFALFDFERQAKLPDGGTARVAFSLAFVADATMPEAAFFVCQQHAPQYFWKPEYQRHANGARAIAEVSMVAADPPVLADFFARMQGERAVRRSGEGLRVTTARGTIAVLSPREFAKRFPGARIANAPPTPHFAAYRIVVADLDAAHAHLRANGIAHRRDAGVAQIMPEHAFGVAIEFVQA